MPRQTREEVMRDLKVEPTVQEGKIRWADHIRGCTELTVWEGFQRSQIVRGHREVGKDDLHIRVNIHELEYQEAICSPEHVKGW